MHEQDQKKIVSMLNAFVIRPGLKSTLYTHCDNCSTVQHSTLLLQVHHFASSISQPESQEKNHVSTVLQISIKQIMVMRGLLHKFLVLSAAFGLIMWP